MIEYRCADCIWWDSEHETVKLIPQALGKKRLGFCRKHKPGSLRIGDYYYGVQPVTDAEEFCGEFRK
jgi:hypothetical protein